MGGCQIIQPEAAAHDGLQVPFGQVLVQHQQVVAEVEKGLARTFRMKRSPPHVIDYRPGCTHQTVSPTAQPPAHVYLLLMGKEAGVQSAGFPVNRRADKEAGTACPEYIGLRIVLPLVFLHDMQDAPSAKGVAVFIHVAAGGSGIFKAVPLPFRQYLRLYAGYGQIGVQHRQGGIQPAGGNLHIAVQQDDVFALYLLQCLVIAFRKAVVLIQRNQLHRRERGTKQCDGVVRRAVVRHDNVRPFRRTVRQDGGEKLLQQCPSVPIQYDDRNCFHVLLYFHRLCVQSQQAGLRRMHCSALRAYCSVIRFSGVSFGEAVSSSKSMV
ncbi:hypothetical protein Barb4_03826 [Bacteroidales bacterium Barb4]|nr:hypothetical protein Barb4_03826 [Bacteroidales bacterium Barb4]